MSYHVQQNTQQRSLGIFIVIAFHVLLIWGLANGLGISITQVFTPDPIQVNQIENPVTPPSPTDPIEPTLPTEKIFVDPSTPHVTFESDTGPVAGVRVGPHGTRMFEGGPEL